jgi:class 3 adenylate cyclase
VNFVGIEGDTMSTSQFTIMVIDAEKFSTHRDPGQGALRKAMYEAMRGAVRDAGLAWEGMIRQDRGDGIILLIDLAQSPITVAAGVVHELENWLAEKATVLHPDLRLRLRVSLHLGAATRDEEGWVGTAINTACRLVDSPAVREALGAGEDPLALIVSDEFYRVVIEPGHRAFSRIHFRRIAVSVKTFESYAWLRTGDGRSGGASGESGPAGPGAPKHSSVDGPASATRPQTAPPQPTGSIFTNHTDADKVTFVQAGGDISISGWEQL